MDICFPALTNEIEGGMVFGFMEVPNGEKPDLGSYFYLLCQ